MKRILKWLNDYLVHIVTFVLLMSVMIIIAIYIYYQDIGNPMDEYRKTDIHDTIEYIHLEPYKGEYIPYVYLKKIGEVRLYVDYESFQVGDSIVKPKNSFDFSLYRNGVIIFKDAEK